MRLLPRFGLRRLCPLPDRVPCGSLGVPTLQEEVQRHTNRANEHVLPLAGCCQQSQVLKLGYPEQTEGLRRLCAASCAEGGTPQSLPAALFCSTFPYHFVVDRDLRLIQAGAGFQRLLPKMELGVSTLHQFLNVRRMQSQPAIHEMRGLGVGYRAHCVFTAAESLLTE